MMPTNKTNDAPPPTRCVCTACGCAQGDHCGATGCCYIIGVDPGVDVDLEDLIEEEKMPVKLQPWQREIERGMRRAGRQRQRPPRGRR